MNCPRCGNPMRAHRIGDVELDECRSCRGIWCDRDELRLAKDRTDPDLNWMDFELWKHEDRFRISSKPFRCPKCAVGMAAVEYGDTGVEVDCCSTCQGTWLEEGEFGKIIDALTKELLTKSSSDYFKETLQEAKEIVLGPERFFSEWKDFVTILRFFRYRCFVENPKLQDTVTTVSKPFR